MKKKLIGLILTGVLMIGSTMPGFGMSILDSTIHAGAGGVSDSAGKTVETAAEDEKEETTAAGNIGCTVPAAARVRGSGVINEGVYAGDVELSGLSETEAKTAVNEHVAELGDTMITLNCVSGNQVTVPASSLGIYWTNTDIIDEALSLGQSGNVIKRFKELYDLKRTNKIYPIELGGDRQKIQGILATECVKYDVKAQDALMKRSDGSFNVTPVTVRL